MSGHLATLHSGQFSHFQLNTETILNDLNLADIPSSFSARLPSPPPLLFKTLQCICCLLRLYCIPFFCNGQLCFKWTTKGLSVSMGHFNLSPLHFTERCGRLILLHLKYHSSRILHIIPLSSIWLKTLHSWIVLFDHTILLDKLLSRSLPNVMVCFLHRWYQSQHLQSKWNGFTSDAFSVSRGVHQGEVLSPILFTLYIDDLLKELLQSGVGC